MPTPRLLALKLISDLKPHLAGKKAVFTTEQEANYFRLLYKKRLPKAPPPLPKPLPKVPKPLPVSKQEETPLPLKPIVPALTLPKREKVETRANASSSWVANFFTKEAQGTPLLDKIPSDAFAKKIATRWKTKNQIAKISLLSYSEPKEQRIFLEKIQTALDIHFGPAKLISAELIEKDRSWDTFLSAKELELVIACDYTLWQLSSLRSFYREKGGAKERFLKEKPLFLLPDLSLYLKDPLLKRSLWRALCQKLST